MSKAESVTEDHMLIENESINKQANVTGSPCLCLF
jgi:hypothetical protein